MPFGQTQVQCVIPLAELERTGEAFARRPATFVPRINLMRFGRDLLGTDWRQTHLREAQYRIACTWESFSTPRQRNACCILGTDSAGSAASRTHACQKRHTRDKERKGAVLASLPSSSGQDVVGRVEGLFTLGHFQEQSYGGWARGEAVAGDFGFGGCRIPAVFRVRILTFSSSGYVLFVQAASHSNDKYTGTLPLQ